MDPHGNRRLQRLEYIFELIPKCEFAIAISDDEDYANSLSEEQVDTILNDLQSSQIESGEGFRGDYKLLGLTYRESERDFPGGDDPKLDDMLLTKGLWHFYFTVIDYINHPTSWNTDDILHGLLSKKDVTPINILGEFQDII